MSRQILIPPQTNPLHFLLFAAAFSAAFAVALDTRSFLACASFFVRPLTNFSPLLRQGPSIKFCSLLTQLRRCQEKTTTAARLSTVNTKALSISIFSRSCCNEHFQKVTHTSGSVFEQEFYSDGVHHQIEDRHKKRGQILT